MRFWVSFIISFICIVVNSQELEVKSFKLAGNDITASSTPRMDYNNDPCALLRILIKSSGVKFSGNIVGDVKHRDNEYLVYMTAGSKTIKISGYDFFFFFVEFGKYGIKQLEGRKVYQLVLVIIVVPINQGMTYTNNKTFRVRGVSFNMQFVEGGTFTMGATKEQGTWSTDNDEYPTHQVTLGNYMIGETEVTQALWKAVMGNNPSDYLGDNRPVEEVSWNDCQQFIKKLNEITGEKFRLPTEAEWEYAARGGIHSQGFRYPGTAKAKEACWYGNSNNGTHEVGKKCPNELGIYDMGGNVWEWCQDWKGDYTSSPVTNPVGPRTGTKRVVRGGSFHSTKDLTRTTHRSSNIPNYTRNYIGLRLAL